MSCGPKSNCEVRMPPVTRGPDGCADTYVYCRTPRTYTLDVAAVADIEVTTQDLAYVRELIATDEQAAVPVVEGVYITRMEIRGKNYLPNGEMALNAFTKELQNFDLPSMQKIENNTPLTLSFRVRAGLTIGIAQLTFFLDERR